MIELFDFSFLVAYLYNQVGKVVTTSSIASEYGLLRSEFNFSECEAGISTKQSDVRLEFGNHPIGLNLKELNLGRVLRYQYWPKQQAILTMACESYMI